VGEFVKGDFDGTLTWDGKDRFGAVVPGGVYLYQVEVEGRVFSGTVVVAK